MSKNQIYTYSYEQRFKDGETVNVQVRGSEQGISNFIMINQGVIWDEYMKSYGQSKKVKPLLERSTTLIKKLKITEDK